MSFYFGCIMGTKLIFICKKLMWLLVLLIGLSIAFHEYIISNAYKSMEAVAMQEVIRDPSSENEPPPTLRSTTAISEEENWIKYGDKIVGWIVALAGAYNLVRRKKESS